MKKGYKHLTEINNDLKVIDDKLNNANSIDGITLSNIEKDFSKINKKIMLTKRDNICKSIIRKVKIFGELLHGAFPYIVVTGITLGFQILAFDTPFIREEQLNVGHHKETYINGVKTEENVEYNLKYVQPYSKAYHTTPWVKGDDGNYHRTVEEFDGKVLSPDVVKEAINNPETKLEEVFGKRRYQITNEVKSEADITEEEKNMPDEYKIILNQVDDEDTAMIIQDASENIGYSFIFFVLILVFSLPVKLLNLEYSCFNLGYAIDRIKDNYNLMSININELKKAFYEKKIKVEKVKRNGVTLTDPIDGSKIYVK